MKISLPLFPYSFKLFILLGTDMFQRKFKLSDQRLIFILPRPSTEHTIWHLKAERPFFIYKSFQSSAYVIWDWIAIAFI